VYPHLIDHPKNFRRVPTVGVPLSSSTQKKEQTKQMIAERYCIGLSITTFWVIVSLLRMPYLYINHKPGQNVDLKVHTDPSPTPTKRILHVLTCETREDSEAYLLWKRSADQWRDSNIRNQKYAELIRINNICKGKKWHGFMTKPLLMQEYLQQHMTEEDRRMALIMFTDSDSVFNSFAFTYPEVLQTYDEAVQGSGDVLVSVEPNCWVGGKCTAEEVQWLYPNATRSSCPQFINSGEYMGPANSVLKVTNEWVNIVAPRHGDNDQTNLAVLHRFHPEWFTLERQAKLFHAALTGMVDASTNGKLNCGVSKANEKFCRKITNHPWYNFHEANSGPYNGPYFSVPVAEECETERIPFSFHSAGISKYDTMELSKNMTLVTALQV
jgi:hypothetical protein